MSSPRVWRRPSRPNWSKTPVATWVRAGSGARPCRGRRSSRCWPTLLRRQRLLRHVSIRQASLRVAATCAIIVALLWLGIAAYLDEEYRTAVNSTTQDARNLSHAFEENIRRTLDAIDATMRAVRVARAADSAGFDLVAW